MADPPTGTVTFLFTDVEGSTRLWEEHPEAMKAALARHDAILRGAIDAHGGSLVKATGDGVHAVFATAGAGVRAALAGQAALEAEAWGATGPLRVRMGMHTGAAELRDGDYYGSAVNRAARLMAAGHGGQVVCSHATAELAADSIPEGALVVDLGEHVLRDLSRPERVFQVAASGMTADFPPLRSLGSFPGNVPAQITSFVGREREVAEVGDVVRRSRVTTVTGVGGVGKTRLAVQVAAELLPEFPDGAWLSELAAAADAESLAQVTAVALGVRPLPGVTLRQSVVEFLRAKELLLVLDNCEHLLRAAGDLAEEIARECPAVRVLATSREGLAVAGEQVWPLRSLPVPAGEALEAVGGAEAVRLFVERARAARPGFSLDATTAPGVAEICRRLDGIPLAIELAAARVVAMNPGEIAGLLDERFRLLTGGRRTAVERHQTLRAAVDWSYSLLTPSEQLVFSRLGVFAGTFDTAAAMAVAAGQGIESWDVLDGLAGLVGKSMLGTDEASKGATRYHLLETMRQYATERLDESAATDSRRRLHAAYFAEVAETIGPQLLGPDELEWRRRLDADRDNLRAAVTWALESVDDADGELAVRIVAALAQDASLDRGGGVSTWAAQTAARAERSSPAQRSAVLTAAAWNLLDLGDPRRAHELAKAALRDGPPTEGVSPSFPQLALSVTAALIDGPAHAVEILEEHKQDLVGRGPGNEWTLATVDVVLGAWQMMGGDFVAGRTNAEEAVAVARELGNPSALAMALYLLGHTVSYDDPARALELARESVALTRAGASDVVFAPACVLIARLFAERGDARAAFTQLRDAVQWCIHVVARAELADDVDYGIDIFGLFGHFDTAAVLVGILEHGALRGLSSMPSVSGLERERRLAAQARVRDALGDARFEELVAHGAQMSHEAAMAFLVDALDDLVAKTEQNNDG